MSAPPFRKALIANRGAIACRIIRTLKRIGVASVAVYSDADASSRHVIEADEAVYIGASPAAESYLNTAAILAAAQATGAEAIHPGYGFLSENVGFAEACAAAGVAFVGPTTDNIRAFGLKHTARALAAAQGVPLAPGTDLLNDADEAGAAAHAITYPVILKASAGGGGIGMRVCEDEAELRAAFIAVTRLAENNFSDGGVFLERYVRRARHIEVQVFGDGAGRVVALGERDCSLQRRNQKVIEETPAPNLPTAARDALIESALRLMRAARYRSAGTVEFLYDDERQDFFFLEVNTRLQVEHGVTEQVAGVDLVEWMMRGAAGDYAFLDAWDGRLQGASIQSRLYAEDPGQDYRPMSGVLNKVSFPADARVETWVETGAEISAFYDPMVAKLIVTAKDRPAAVKAMQAALAQTHLSGVETNLAWLRDVAQSDAFVSGQVTTRTLAELSHASGAVRVLSGGPQTTVQDYPGRMGLWDVGIPPSGPMDDLGLRLANRIVGNAPSAACLEFAAMGPTLSFESEALACLTGADFGATLDGAPVATYTPFKIKPGQTLKIGRVREAGLRGYLAVRGGFAAPDYLGSKSTFVLGNFGGAHGRVLAAGDVLRVADESIAAPSKALPAKARPALTKAWRIRVLLGPHGAPDFFTEEGLAALRDAEWRVSYNSGRTGVRLDGPKPQWARRDGGEAGLHPSNIHDNAYAIGAVNFTGDMAIILGPDGPSLGGFVCPFAIIIADLWMVGQLAPGDKLTFEAVDVATAEAALQAQERFVETLKPEVITFTGAPSPAVMRVTEAAPGRPRVVYRRQGDDNILVEYGELVLDLELRLRVHALMLELDKLKLPGLIDVTPGIRSLQLHFDGRVMSQSAMLDALIAAEERLGALDDFEIASRVVWLPLSWNDPSIRDAVERYQHSVREDAPWTPDNIEFIRRINGLDSVEDVRRIVFDARYLVLGLGDVYLGAPAATPIDPRHRLVTTKYNPARIYTPQNAVGIGGAYMCIYGMEGPGGYQLVGRTIQIWNTHRKSANFADGKPWLLRFFDQVRYFPVSPEELIEWRRDFPSGRRALRIEHETFRLKDYRALLSANRDDIAAFQTRRQAAFDAERADWERRGEFARVEDLADAGEKSQGDAIVAPDGCDLIEAPLGGRVWKMLVGEGAQVRRGQVVAIIEAMKTECEVASPADGIVRGVYAQEKAPISPGAALFAIAATP